MQKTHGGGKKIRRDIRGCSADTFLEIILLACALVRWDTCYHFFRCRVHLNVQGFKDGAPIRIYVDLLVAACFLRCRGDIFNCFLKIQEIATLLDGNLFLRECGCLGVPVRVLDGGNRVSFRSLFSPKKNWFQTYNKAGQLVQFHGHNIRPKRKAIKIMHHDVGWTLTDLPTQDNTDMSS